MLSTSAPTKWSKRWLAGTSKMANTILWLRVRYTTPHTEALSDVLTRPAASGAAATIASDALMNPFDGENRRSICRSLPLTRNSDQTANASPRFDILINIHLRTISLQSRRPDSILRLVPYDTMHDRPFHCLPIYGLRVAVQSHEPAEGIRPNHPLRRGRPGRRIRGWHHDTLGRDQNPTTDTRSQSTG
jgi:hypothetical protein